MYRTQFHEANGISGSNPGSALKNMRQIITNNRQITNGKFDIEVRNIMEIEGYKSDWPQAHVVADELHGLFNHINEINAQQTGRPLFKDPRTAWRYIPHNKKMNMLRQREDFPPASHQTGPDAANRSVSARAWHTRHRFLRPGV